MATTIESFTSGAGQVLFPFTIEYIAQSDLKVAIDGTDTTLFTFANATTVELNTAPTTGAVVAIRRDTDADTIASEFFPGSSIRAQDLNSNFTQSLYVAQEVIREAGEATTESAAALAKSETALTDSAAAVVTSNAATQTANTASSNANSAVSIANTANTTATTAASDAATAVTTANTSLTNSTAAVTTANTALTDSATANTTADSAVTSATNANTTAASAVTTANAAQASASNAVTTADSAATDAAAAVTTANAANTTAGQADTNASAAVITANAASAAASLAVSFTLVSNVAGIGGLSPSDGDRIEVGDSTGIESFSSQTGLPSGFVGASGLSIRLEYSSSTSLWGFMSYFANDPEDRYLTKNVPVVTGDSTNGSGQITLNCENNSHGVKIKGPPHSAAASYTLTLPDDTGTSGYVLKTDGSGTTTWGGADVVFDTTPQLGGDLDVNGHEIVSSGTNTDIDITAARHITLSVDNDVSGHDGAVQIIGGPLSCGAITNAGVILGSTPTLRGSGTSGTASLSNYGSSANSIESEFRLSTDRLDLFFDNQLYLQFIEGQDLSVYNTATTNRGFSIAKAGSTLKFKPPASFVDTTYYLPAADGSAGEVLSTDGSGNMSWASPPGREVFLGFKRTTSSKLELTYSTESDTTTYPIKDFVYKNTQHSFLSSNNIIHTTGALAGQPKLEFNTNGHLILSI
jgi:hypothetical protein